MAEYIEREAAIESVKKHWGDENAIIASLILIPVTDVAPMIHGHWTICKSYNPAFNGYECSECGAQFQGYRPDNYCGNCGAKMDGES